MIDDLHLNFVIDPVNESPKSESELRIENDNWSWIIDLALFDLKKLAARWCIIPTFVQ